MMKHFCFLLLLLIQSHGILGFVIPPGTTSTSPRSPTTELHLFRKDGKVRSGFRKVRGFLGRRILGRKQPEPNNKENEEELDVVMRDDTESAVENMVPVVPIESTVPSIEEEEETSSVVEETTTSDAETEALKAVAEAEAALAALEEAKAQAAEEIKEEVVNQQEEVSVVVEEEKVVEEPEPEPEPAVVEDSIVEKVDQLFAEGKPQLAMDMMLKEETDVKSNGDLYWRFVKAHYEMFSATTNEAEQKSFLEKGIELVNEAPAQFEDDTNTKAFLLKWKAILLGKLGGFQSTKEKMANSFVIKESLEEANDLLQSVGEEDGSIYQALGEWCFKVAGISFIERQAASMLFGTPPQSSYDEALQFFLKGYELKSTPTLATKVSETYQKMGQKQLARQWANKAVAKEEILMP